MGWYTMPDCVVETAFERMIKEGKTYQISEEIIVAGNTTVWLYLQLPEDKDVLLQARNISATAGPIRYKVYPGATLVGPLGIAVNPEKLNALKNGPSQTQIHRVPATSVDITGIPPFDAKLVVATETGGNRGNGAQSAQNFFKVYGAGTKIAISIANVASVTSYVELHYLWAEEVE